MLLIILLGIHWYLSDNTTSNTLTNTSFIPNIFDFNNWIATSIVMSLCGIEITIAHVKKTIYPQRNYPIALLFSTFIILATLILASLLSIAAVAPTHALSFVSGVVQSLEVFLKENGLLVLLKYFVFAAVIGSLGAMNNWLIAPIQGLQEAAKDGLLPKVF